MDDLYNRWQRQAEEREPERPKYFIQVMTRTGWQSTRGIWFSFGEACQRAEDNSKRYVVARIAASSAPPYRAIVGRHGVLSTHTVPPPPTDHNAQPVTMPSSL